MKHSLDQANDLFVWHRLLDVVVHSCLEGGISESFGALCGTAANVGLAEDSVDIIAGIKRVVDLARFLIYEASNVHSDCWSVHDRHAVIKED